MYRWKSLSRRGLLLVTAGAGAAGLAGCIGVFESVDAPTGGYGAMAYAEAPYGSPGDAR